MRRGRVSGHEPKITLNRSICEDSLASQICCKSSIGYRLDVDPRLWVLAVILDSFFTVRPQLVIGIFVNTPDRARSLEQILQEKTGRYSITVCDTDAAFFDLIEQQKQQIDCLVLQESHTLAPMIEWLHAQATLLPTVILEPEISSRDLSSYHAAQVRLSINDLDRLTNSIDRAIDAFLDLSPSLPIPVILNEPELTRELTTQNFLMRQQKRLIEKLNDRLGYLSVYYRRDSKQFLRNLSHVDREALLQQLRLDYRDIILNYFLDSLDLNQKIDNFVNTVFFADIPVSQIVETHMELMDEFSKQLKLEGRSEEILLDYRLTLIDTIAHLCEMYRRSIPRES